MQNFRNRLLITLALLGVLALAAPGARANPIAPQKVNEDGPGLTWYASSDPSNAGEPDGGASGTLPQHSGSNNTSSSVMTQGVDSSAPVMSFVQVLRMARVFLMARYLGIAP